MKKTAKRIRLNRETLLDLGTQSLGKAAGGNTDANSGCISKCASDCTTCFYNTCGHTCLCGP